MILGKGCFQQTTFNVKKRLQKSKKQKVRKIKLNTNVKRVSVRMKNLTLKKTPMKGKNFFGEGMMMKLHFFKNKKKLYKYKLHAKLNGFWVKKIL